ncbi:UDP-N-acetylmuramoyl-L-alanyl-D-glutamate--2,6-diaminopimelate ligase [Prochlorothrix hollandica]|uniref:UDP-N-acetylmuramoyl-L-alanyl-D-glutamate--2,6-diaminopimelate ligase n=1 Tax=Prochlorothrix hollandica PCC 9006 = CALU 1027 TaxID=317619 RepID=A0A0M2Q089_PROHO|nr:UDP-N-acetylmuramoyl-L-alanyl-D-glutamate--2,6-diaminopimelate ligase [Prochlorothrix hollandica]KKJ00354.1 UDP-N-acetylmuramoylalanyl-D-glutamate--2,6-diaminopimelate ligase [Prochlorothrix hollandica PCC 9006 = CALU 1027]
MELRSLLQDLPGLSALPTHVALDHPVKGLQTNSHACNPGDLFIGMPGTRVDGGEFWAGALAAGAVAAVISQAAYQAKPPSPVDGDPCLIVVDDVTPLCAHLAARFHGYPAQALPLVGVTGTNGKTTTTHLIEFFLSHSQHKPALFGTLYARWQGFQETAAHTTPFATTLQQQLAAAVAAGCSHGVLEVSSHALDQQRVATCPFDVAVFTNLTQDHLDYHPTLEDYFAAKAKLFSPAYLQGRAVVNGDDAYGQRLMQDLPPERVWSYSLSNPGADLWTENLTYGATGVSGLLHTPQGSLPFTSPLVGQFNVANVLGAIGAGLHLGLGLEFMVAALPQFTGVPGRMERVQISPYQDITVVVDYAHTPDSLENLLQASRPFIQGRMICVFGCGGDRDRTKRPLMGAIAARLADVAGVTSDNPRTEDPQQILADVVAGIPPESQFWVQGDRAVAIAQAIAQAQPGDGVLIAGKGHEDYQILGTEKIHFDDREQARSALQQRQATLDNG